ATASDSEGGSQGQSAGISFAIPLATIESRVTQMIAGGELRTGFMGISFNDGEEPVYDANGKHVGLGVTIGRVTPDGPAANAGLRAGDIIIAVDGEETSSSDVMRAIISSKSPGTKVPIRVYRDGLPLEFEVTLGAISDEARAQNFERLLLEQYGFRVNELDGKVIVDRVFALGGGVENAFKPGETITAVNEQPVAGMQQFLLSLDKAGAFLGRRVQVRVEYIDENGHTLQRDVTMRQAE
ncbi:MAG: PDZ domain-containing protein, partial [Phycisphaerae bacterium]